MAHIGNTTLEVFRFCLGGNVFGWTVDERQSFEVLDAYAAAGGNFIDTADVYSAWVSGHSGGESETRLRAQPTVIAPIASARTAGQLAELLPFVNLTLTDEELARLNAV